MLKRTLLKEIESHLSKKEITIIVGPRQAGKTTLMLFLEDKLKRKAQRTLFLNLDIEEDRQFFISQSKLISKINLEIGTKNGYVFIDEIQRKEDAGLFLKGLYDRNLPYKFIVSGSGSMELKEKIHESLAGRKQVFELTTLSFDEFVNYKTGYKYENTLNKFFELDTDRTSNLLEEYLNFGGYPRVALEEEIKEKRKVIDEIFRSYIDRDIASFLRVEKLEGYSQLIRILSAQTGNMVNYNELSNTLGISMPTIKNYLWYAEKTFIIQKITPYFRNIRKEITKSPVYYFHDIGLRNYAIGMFGMLSQSSDFGFPFENFILNLLKEKIRFTGANIHFWRTKDGAEVDFIIDYRAKQIPVEVKYKKLSKPETSRSFLSFIKKYAPKNAVVVNLSLNAVEHIGKTTIHFLPFYRLQKML
ncbi:MAG: ATPase [Nitrospirae bacterium CG_4_10_14_3_um_filter_44_29]|nr:ATP-binding protein [Nitrospirota bacterium]OIO32056.1 MAG: ATPase [Nitrospirae bacterium CG1_02_44_142]PIP70716.1 MAG: ATPase [Nitrospirae bacterium CG22_combo_CG10-13_8_21_14_all_44_11]PIV41711.1 MAG: ATPase [Nitrospirae bacterium CG02_land_8_20_14_3_00_44_33]PIV66096.1 MAG: ATPase [Nitrospirae bacterium CG01_land_8_20_14_3_00_44_22]PIW89090.1 MAG: ATPase [Nitrospirae bacterium CG_4_8_14_3_um_filter_44_28]PIX89817.1 MAG: ATPase [Nitrospirae bacterium CG_4_10_14_3_um_filter_44_29]PJA8164